MLDRLAAALAHMVGRGRVKLVRDDGPVQMLQVDLGPTGATGPLGLRDNTPRVAEYGFSSSPPPGSVVIVLALGGDRTEAVAIASHHQATRPTDLQPGEAMLYNGLTGAYVRLCADGKIRSKGDWIHDGDLDVTGDIRDRSGDGGTTVHEIRSSYNAHKHGGVATGAGQSGVPDNLAT